MPPDDDIPDLADFGDVVPEDKPLDYEAVPIHEGITHEQMCDISMQAIVMGAAVIWELDANELAKALILMIALHVCIGRQKGGDTSEANENRLAALIPAVRKLPPRVVAAAFDAHELLEGHSVTDRILDDAHSIALAMNAENN